ncbi:hypothetical protein [Kitasatospora kifunensis]|uniref:Uncharacterized protein n=1 Tax=Kitasatospora kifunensis TaxID=58351 RepID=A0A7W7R4V7_KITKI|nr:hypothetical protein [Kitasatospora kifunensis]MBB4925280.1 hypothetical protein [Kitasatospora kifunensis]
MGTHRRPRRPLVPPHTRRALRAAGTLAGLTLAGVLSLAALSAQDHVSPLPTAPAGPTLTELDGPDGLNQPDDSDPAVNALSGTATSPSASP